MPLVTCPNTVWTPSRWGWGAWQMKNWLPPVSLPACAMASVPAMCLCTLRWVSHLMVYPGHPLSQRGDRLPVRARHAGADVALLPHAVGAVRAREEAVGERLARDHTDPGRPRSRQELVFGLAPGEVVDDLHRVRHRRVDR